MNCILSTIHSIKNSSNIYHMKIRIICWILALIGLIQVSVAQTSIVWKQQLDAIKENTTTSSKYPKLVSYSYKGKIENNNDVKQLKNVLLSDNAYFPIKENGEYILMNIRELRQVKGDENVQIAIKNLSSYFDKVVCIGLSTIELTWECSNKTYKSMCITSDEKGIVFDSIILNMFDTNNLELGN